MRCSTSSREAAKAASRSSESPGVSVNFANYPAVIALFETHKPQKLPWHRPTFTVIETAPSTNGSITLEPDAEQLGRFVRSVFVHASAGSYVSLRAFPREAGKPALFVRGFQIEQSGLDNIIAGAVAAAREAANHALGGVVFAPPPATFDNHYHARQVDLVNGLVLNVDCDCYPGAALERLSSFLGPPTLVVESGGYWLNPETGELEDRLHLYWRLAVAVRDQEGFAKLREARMIASHIAFADRSNIPIVHPIRWPGSWHTKSEPRLCRIVEQSEREIDLDVVLQLLGKAAPKLRDDIADRKRATRSYSFEAGDVDLDELQEATMAIPNDNFLDVSDSWYRWKVDIGMSLFRATNGSEAGLEIWLLWSAPSPKFNKRNTRAEWEKIRRSPPTIITKRKIFRIAQEEYGWQRPLKVLRTVRVDNAVDLDAVDEQTHTIMHNFINNKRR